MKNERQKQLNENLDDVITTSKDIRNYLLDENVADEEKKEKLKVLKTALEANKNILDDNDFNKLEKLKELLDKKIITQEDYDCKKKEILEKM